MEKNEIAVLRKKRKMTQIDLADHMGCSQSHVSLLERGIIQASEDEWDILKLLFES